ncbi:MAG: type IV pilus secretin PilQ [Desulfobacterales bacterium]|jgi:type IV pilus assembly protein PilQ
MIYQFKDSQKIFLLIIPLIFLVAWSAGCASNKAVDVKATDTKRIMGITTNVTPDSVIVTINGNQALTYTAIKQVFPMGVLFHFPETSLDTVKTVTTPPDNPIVGSVKATELVEDQSTTSRIFIAMKADAPYDLKPGDTGLRISFPKVAARPTVAKPPVAKKPSAPPKPQPVPTKDLPAASRIKTVSATPLKDNVVVNVQADGAVKNYKSFTIDGKQPRIVIDMFKIKSPYKKEQRLTVKSPWVKQVRHFGYPDKVRLVLDTPKASLAKYSASPTAKGLVVHVGKLPAAAKPAVKETAKPVVKQKKPIVAQKKAEPKPVVALKSDRPAWVNRIDFSSEEAGKSSLIIGTTVPVKYDLQKAGSKRLHLKLINTSLPDYRKRALITTRFESAVDRVTPIQTAAMKGDSLITIELREAVPYFVDHKDNTLRINFAASSIPPKPYEDADLPEWKKVLAEAPTTPAMKAEKAKIAEAKAAEKEPVDKKPDEKAAAPDQEKTLEQRLAEISPQKRYTGEKIALDFFDTDIKNVFRILREISGKNFAIDKNVTGKVTLTLERPVPWDQVLDLVLKMNQLGMTMEGDIVRIATLSTLAQEEKLKQAQLKAAQAAQKQAEALEPLFTEYIPVSYSNATKEVLPHVTAILTDGRGKANVDERNNQLIITDTATIIQRAKQIVQKIDTVTPQVVIEARIVEAITNFLREIGFDWGEVTLGAIDIPGTDYEFGPTQFLADNIPANFPDTGSLSFNLFKTSGTPFSIVEAQLAAQEVEGKTNIISSPKIVTLDNKQAKIKQGFEFPYEERDSSGNATVRFKNIDLLLEVTPSVTPDNRIAMNIFVTKNEVAEQTLQGPALSTNEAQTEILVDDGDTIVIGGILKSSIVWGERGIPGLRKMGVLGWLFKFQSESDDKNELLIFITPRIVKLEQKRL